MMIMSTPVHDVFTLPAIVSITAVVFGGLSGALHATRRGLDSVGIFTSSRLCAVGGGVIRDVLLQNGIPAFLVNPLYLGLAALAALVGYFLASVIRIVLPVMQIVDTLLLGSWVLLGAEKALQVGLTFSAAVLLGVITATGGGLIRDLLCHETPAMVRPGEWYGFVTIVAAFAFVLMVTRGVPLTIAEISTMVIAAAMRIAAIRFELHTPTAYDLWGDLESRVSAGLERSRRSQEIRQRKRARAATDASRG